MSVTSVTLAVAVAVLSAGTAFAQGWYDYISRDEFFLVSVPSESRITSTTYRAASGAMLPAKQLVSTDGQRRYTVTVVHHMNASAADEAAAVEHVVRSFRNRGSEATYDRAQVMEGVPGHRISVRGNRLRDGSEGCLLGFVTSINGTAMDKEFD